MNSHYTDSPVQPQSLSGSDSVEVRPESHRLSLAGRPTLSLEGQLTSSEPWRVAHPYWRPLGHSVSVHGGVAARNQLISWNWRDHNIDTLDCDGDCPIRSKITSRGLTRSRTWGDLPSPPLLWMEPRWILISLTLSLQSCVIQDESLLRSRPKCAPIFNLDDLILEKPPSALDTADSPVQEPHSFTCERDSCSVDTWFSRLHGPWSL